MHKKIAASAKAAEFKNHEKHTIHPKDVKDQARGIWGEILITLAPHLEEAFVHPGSHVPCPVHGGKDGFRVFEDVEESGGGICNTCGGFSDGFALLQWANDWTFKQALYAVSEYMEDPDKRPKKDISPCPVIVSTLAPDNRKFEAIARVWSESLHSLHPAALPLRLYLEGRGIILKKIPNAIRYHPALYCSEDGMHYSSMVAMVSGPDGAHVTVHRTYLTNEGEKAKIEIPKKLMACATPGATRGGAIRLFDTGPKLAIAEGIETALSVHLDTGLPVWAGISAGGMEAIAIPDQVEEVIICADNDERGKKAAARLAYRLLEEGRRVNVAVPPIEGDDWNDARAREVRHG